jgi:hypothetical protein
MVKTDINRIVREQEELGNFNRYGRRFATKQSSFLVFVDDVDRPFNNGDIMGDFAWRRTHAAPVKPSELKKKLIDRLAPLGIEIENVSYNRYAGCSSCPCSPGYVVKLKNQAYFGQRVSFWM